MPDAPYIKANSLTEKGKIYPHIPSFWLDERVFKQAAIAGFYLDLITFIIGELNILATEGINTLFPQECKDTIKLTTFPLFINPQDIEYNQKNTIYFDGQYTFQSQLSFSNATSTQQVIPLPPNVIDIDLFVDNPVSPSIIWVNGQDFSINKYQKKITLYATSSLDKVFSKTSLDEYILWARGITLKTNLLSTIWGTLLPINTIESRYHDLTEIYHIILEILTQGISTFRINKLLSHTFGFPILENGEKILGLSQDGTKLITNKKLVNIPNTATLRKATLPGDPITNACTIYQPKNELPDPENLPFIILNKQFLPDFIPNPILFPNQLIPTYTVPNPNRVRLIIPEQQDNFDLFFSKLEQKLIENHQNPLLLFNNRIPTQINPARWLAKTLLPANSNIIHIDLKKCHHKPIPYNLDKVLDKLLPPGKILHIQIEISSIEEINLTQNIQCTTDIYNCINIEETMTLQGESP